MKPLVLFFLICCIHTEVFTQNTVGVLNNSLDAYEGYILYAPIVYTSTYLIDNCGRVINQWDSEFIPGLASYMIPGGKLLRAGRDTDTDNFNSAGTGGIIQIFDWDGNLEWQAHVNDAQFGAHHDIEYLPNGNILLLRWEKKNSTELIQAGKDPDFVPSEIWLPSVVEIKPLEFEVFDIVWEWHLFDHFVQDVDSSKDNFGLIADNPRKVNINYDNITSRDWGHLNCIDYNESRNEVLLSCRNFDEIWIIDHSTTSAEAASDTGGGQNLGGQLLFRYGNDGTYQNTNEISVFDGQHDAEFKPASNGSDVSIHVYNNNNQNKDFSESYEFFPKLDAEGRYALVGNRFDIVGSPIIFEGSEERNLDSPIMSSVQRLPNGNLLFNAGRVSNFAEFDSLGNEVWRYRGPISFVGPIEQGSSLSGGTFRIEKYSVTDPMFDNLDTSIKAESIELNPNLINCGLSTSATSLIPLESSVYPNPFDSYITVEVLAFDEVDLEVYNSLGSLVLKQQINTKEQLDLNALPTGIYYLNLQKDKARSSFKIIKF